MPRPEIKPALDWRHLHSASVVRASGPPNWKSDAKALDDKFVQAKTWLDKRKNEQGN